MSEEENESFHEDSEEEEEEEESPDYHSGRSKKRKRDDDEDVRRFLDIQAVEDDEEEEEYDEEAEHGFIEKGPTVALPPPSSFRRPSFLESAEPDEAMLEERFRGIEYEDEDIDNTEMRKQSALPTVKDPKLWVVKCKQGKERAAVFSIMQKFYNTQSSPDRLLIKSAIAPDHLKGFIYIEAEKEAHVTGALKGFRNLQQYGFQLVPIKDMVDVLAVSKKTASLARGDWVRIKRGLYSGDLAQVFEYEEARARVIVKLIPRIDYSEKPSSKEKSGDEGSTGEKPGPKSTKKELRPAPAFFNPQEARALSEQLHFSRNDGTYTWRGNRFKDGYLLKSMNIKSIDSINVAPSLEELQKFQSKAPTEPDEEGGESVPAEETPLPAVPQRKVHFSKGDTVKVIEGDLKNLMGIVDSVDGDTITMLPKHDQLKDLLKISASQLQKYFKTGDHIKVIAGRYEGETGFIMKIEGSTLTVFSDLTNQEIKVLSQDVQECAEVTSGKMHLGNYDLHDLIQLDALTVGVIVKIERDSFKVLDNNGNIQTISLQEAGRKRSDKGARTFDAHSNPIGIDDIVQVIDGAYKGKQGTIKHIYKYFAFLHSKQVLENGGMFVVRTGSCIILGGNKAKTPMSIVPQSPRHYTSANTARNAPSVGAGRGRGGGGGPPARRRGDDPILDKTVVIQTGPYKGYVGIVKNATKTTARVELHTNCKTITVQKEDLKVKDTGAEMESPSRRPGFSWSDARTPMHEGFQTPMRNPLATPMRPSTPLHGTAWDPTMPNTPMRHSTPAWEPSSSSSSSGGWGSSSSSGGWGSSDWNSVSTPGTSQFVPYSPARPNQGSDHPNTPGGYDTPNFTPGTSFSDQRTPQGNIATPVGNYSYDTPAYTPGEGIQTPGQTPHTEHVSDEPVDKEWQTPDILVKISESFSGGQYGNAEAVIRDVNANSCVVQVVSSKEMLNVPHHYLEPVAPSKKHMPVKIIRGPLKGKQGTLYGIEGGEAIVKMSSDLDIKILELHNLAVYAAED